MEISNNQSWYVNSNTRQVTSNIKNTAIKDREAFNGSMQNLLNPVEDLTGFENTYQAGRKVIPGPAGKLS